MDVPIRKMSSSCSKIREVSRQRQRQFAEGHHASLSSVLGDGPELGLVAITSTAFVANMIYASYATALPSNDRLDEDSFRSDHDEDGAEDVDTPGTLHASEE